MLRGREFWSAILNYTCCKSVVDCSPGSGILATQCLEENIPYYGLVKSSAHAAWVSNVLDFAALKMPDCSTSPLYAVSNYSKLRELCPVDLAKSNTNSGYCRSRSTRYISKP